MQGLGALRYFPPSTKKAFLLLEYSQLRPSRISGDLTNRFDLDKIQVTVLYTFVCMGNWDIGK